MAIVYYPLGYEIYKRTTTTGSLVELALNVPPNAVFVFTGSSEYSGSINFNTTTASYSYTSSWAINAINGGTQLSTGSTYPITTSWAINAINGGTQLSTGSTYPITSSWATNAINGGTQLATASTYPITASYAVTSSYNITSSYALTSSIANSVSTTIPYTTLQTASANIYGITCSFADTKETLNFGVGNVTYIFTQSNVPSSGQYSQVSLFITNTITGASASLSFPTSWTFIGVVPTYISASKNAYLNLEAFGNSIVAAWGWQY
jgi:hypothetical protein